MTFKCNVCRDEKTVRLPTYGAAVDITMSDIPEFVEPGWKDLPCPQCAMVPYKRVRAMKVTSSYEAEYFGQYQVPIERSLAARFGEYLFREGLLRFTQKGSKDFGVMGDKIVVTAHLGVVAREDVRRSGATPEVATTKPPKLPSRLTEREKRGLRIETPAEVLRWDPPALEGIADDPVTDEFDEPKDALGQRFAGLEID